MDKDARKAIIELEERVAELERQVEQLINREPGWTEERVEEIPQEIFGMFVKYLDALGLGFSAEEFRKFALECKDATHASLEKQFPGEVEKNMIGWERMITRHIMATMVPASREDDQPGASSSPD